MAGDRTSQLGAKLGPRLAQLMADATIASRRGLFDTEHRLRVASTQTVVDAMGLELGSIMGPLTDPILKRNVLPPQVQRVMEQMTSGRHQWQALAGMAWGASGASGMLGTIMSNFLAPLVYDAVGADPLLVPDVGTLASLAARQLIGVETAYTVAGGLGYARKWVEPMILAAQQRPDIGTLFDLRRRNLVQDEDIIIALTRAGFAQQFAMAMVALIDVPLTPSDAALAVLRGIMPADQGRQIAHLSGVSATDFDILVNNTGEPPALQDMLSLWRRGKIDDATLERSIRQSRVRDEWIPTVKEMGVIPPSPAEALNALLQGQISESEARRRYVEGGGDPTWFTAAFDSGGSAPTPDQLGVMANRGIIPWMGAGPDVVSFEQGFKEGPWRNKWLEPYRKASEYFPPPRTVTALLNSGAITVEQAQKLLLEQGLSPELAAAYTTESAHTKTTKQRDLAVSQITTLYTDQAIDANLTRSMLETLGYDTAEADFIITIADLQRVTRFTEAAISTVHTQYTNYRIDRSTASTELDALQVPAGQRDQLLMLWDGERKTRQKTLTETQIHSAFKKGILTAEDAMTKMVQIGYAPDDAAILLQL